MENKHVEPAPPLENFYEIYNIPYLARKSEIEKILYIADRKAHNLEEKRRAQLAFEYLAKDDKIRASYDNYLKRHGVKFPLKESEKRARRKFVVVTSAIMAGVLTIAGFSIDKALENKKEKELFDLENNVCIEYVVQEGDTKEFLNKTFAEHSFSYLEVSGLFRDAQMIYAGDVVIGRTTKQKAEELVASGHARIISIDEAIELLGENNSLIGEFRSYAEGKSDFVFFVPEGKTMI